MEHDPTSTGPTATAPAVPARRSAFVAAVLGWMLPGLGQLYAGRPLKALLMLVAIGGLFYAGLVLTGFTCVDPQAYSLEFVAHALLGGPTAVTYYLTRDVSLQQALPWFEAGRLYAAVAGLLNVVAVCDALGDVLDHNRGVRAAEARRAHVLREHVERQERLLAEAARREAELAAVVDADQGQLPLDAPEEPRR